MDIVLGLENMSVYDCMDVITGRVRAENAIIRLEHNRKLSFLPAPAVFRVTAREGEDAAYSIFNTVTAERVSKVFGAMRAFYDYIIIDSSAEESPFYRAFAIAADDAIVVSFHQSTAIRAAEKTAARLAELGHTNIRLVVNCFHRDKAADESLPDLLEMIHRSKIRLLGVIPYDKTLLSHQESGQIAFTDHRWGKKLEIFEAAYINLAKRLCGIRTPLLINVYKPKRLKKYLPELEEKGGN